MSLPLQTSAGFLPIARSLLGQGTRIRFVARGRSMEPTLRDGDLVTVAPLGNDTPRVGEIVLRSGQGRTLVHRVIAPDEAVKPSQIVTRGDSMGEPDPPVATAEVLGRVVATSRPSRSRRLKLRIGRLGGRWLPHQLRRLLTI